MLENLEVPPTPATRADNSPIPKELFAALYDDLHRLAARQLHRHSAATLSPTTLLHETFLRLAPPAAAAFTSEKHFLAYAARAMRGLVIDHVRNRRAQKRGAGCEITSLPTELPHVPESDAEIEQVGEALDELAAIQPRLAECVDLRFFCGFSMGQIAELWQVSERTVQREWDKARLLLNCLLKQRQKR
jgi:RNA polymerase sigma factor (TIGR02999 family)